MPETQETSIPQAKPDLAAKLARHSLYLGIASVLTCLVVGLGVIPGVLSLIKSRQALRADPAISTAKCHINGKSLGGLGTAISAVIAVIVIIAIILPPSGVVREKACRISCASNLKQIGLALQQYAIDNNGYYPSENGVAGFKMLVDGNYLTCMQLFICPRPHDSDRKIARKLCEPGESFTEENVSYLYLGAGLKQSDSPELALAADKPNMHQNFGNILFLDGRVIMYSDAAWIKNIKLR